MFMFIYETYMCISYYHKSFHIQVKKSICFKEFSHRKKTQKLKGKKMPLIKIADGFFCNYCFIEFRLTSLATSL